MPAAAALDTRELALDLHRLLRSTDPIAWRAGAESRLRRRLATVQLRASRLAARKRAGPSYDRIVALHRSVRAAAPRGRAQWMALRRRLTPIYGDLEAELSLVDLPVPAHRPTNLLRSAIHVGTAVLVAGLIAAWVHTPARMLAITGPLLLAVWGAELARRVWPGWNRVIMRAVDGIAHTHERRRVNSATWYVTALFLLALIGDPVAAAVGVAVLGLGDPMAGFVGRRWGRLKLYRGRSLQGSAAFVAAGAVATLLVVVVLTTLGVMALPTLPWLTALVLGGSLLGAVAELLADRVDDNLLVPVCVGVFAALLGLVSGVA